MTPLAPNSLPSSLAQDKLFPFHVAVDAHDLTVVQLGSKLCVACPELTLGAALTGQFRIERPSLPALTADALRLTLNDMHTWTVAPHDDNALVLNGQLVQFGDILVLFAVPSFDSVRHSHTLSLLDIPVFSRVCETPFHFNITELALESAAPLSNTQESMQMPSRSVLKGCMDAVSKAESARYGDSALRAVCGARLCMLCPFACVPRQQG